MYKINYTFIDKNVSDVTLYVVAHRLLQLLCKKRSLDIVVMRVVGIVVVFKVSGAGRAQGRSSLPLATRRLQPRSSTRKSKTVLRLKKISGFVKYKQSYLTQTFAEFVLENNYKRRQKLFM